jgi:hypothetical protein
MEKRDLTKMYKSYYSASVNPSVALFGKIKFLTITGAGEPSGSDFKEKTQTLYSVAYGVKKVCKEAGKDFAVPKLEGLWWANGDKTLLSVPLKEWQWKLLIRMTDDVSKEVYQKAVTDVQTKKKLALAGSVMLETIDEGKTVSILHKGPYDNENATIERMYKFIDSEGLKKNGVHHEIYLSDPNKTAPDKMRTILRQPVK